MPTQWKGKLLSMERVPDLDGMIAERGVVSVIMLAKKIAREKAIDDAKVRLIEKGYGHIPAPVFRGLEEG